MSVGRKVIFARVDIELYQYLNDLAEREERPMAYVVRKILRRLMEDEKQAPVKVIARR